MGDLRRRAEKKVLKKEAPPEELSPADAARLIHELRAHQIELEMQNEDLRLSQVHLEESRSKYADLYDFAPVGYLTLDGRGRIVEANMTAAALLGVERHKLLGRFFSHFLVEADRLAFLQLVDYGLPQRQVREEFRLEGVKGEIRTLLLDILFLRDAEDQEQRRIAMIDITERKQAEQALQQARDELEQRVLERTADLRHTVEQLEREITERQHMAEALRALTSQLLTAQENERKRLAAELHDELGHALLAMKLHLSSIEKKMLPEQEELKAEIRTEIDYVHEVIQEVRRLYHDLSPGDLEDLGLTKALRTLINDFADHVPQINWQVDLVELEGLFSLPAQTIIYRTFQEALTNIGKHADPTLVTISSQTGHDQVRFIVEDNGNGFNVEALGSRGSGRGLGLVAMEERLKLVGGSFQIQSREQEGTRLSFTIPILPEREKP